MSENKHLGPICILYLDGARLGPAYEGALRSVTAIDRLNGISRVDLAFDRAEMTKEDAESFVLGGRLVIHLGYKDDTREVFSGDVEGLGVLLREHEPEIFKVQAAGGLARLDHGVRNRSFEGKSPSGAIQQILESYNLKADVEGFGAAIPYWEGGQRKDLDLVLYLAGRYGRDVYCHGEAVQVKDLIRGGPDEIIYEWGKSLSWFRVGEDIRGQVSGSVVMGWDHEKGEGFRVSKKIGDIRRKIGGGTAWTEQGKGGEGRWVDYRVDVNVRDKQGAEELAAGMLQKKSWGYIRAEGSGEGNAALSAGMEMTVKGVGEIYTGTYLVETATHRFEPATGYITSFTAKRNMLEGVYRQGPGGGSGGGTKGSGKSGAKDAAAGGSRQAESSGEDAAEEEEQKKAPGFENLRWEKDGKETGEALVDDEVTLCFDVKNINNGERVNVTVWEHDEDNEHDHAADLSGTVENGKIAIKWRVVYTEDNDDSTSGKELAEQGYTLPEYHFVAEYDGAESGESPVLEVRGWIEGILKDKKTGEALAERGYTLYLPDGSQREGRTDKNGEISEKNDISIGACRILFHDE
jgi:phage protein D